jgi:hypothetical protein
MYWRTLYGTRRRRTVALTCLVLAGACSVRFFWGGWTDVPPETTVGSVPLFALALVQVGWIRGSERRTTEGAGRGDVP